MLHEILEVAVQRAEQAAANRAELRAAAADAPAVRPFGPALVGDELAVIGEIKRRSPSAGVLAPNLSAGRQAEAYAAGGAAALSVLTEPVFFAGSAEDLHAARAASPLPVLRKDFTVDDVQVWEARAMGADAILLIVAALSDEQLGSLLETAQAAGVDALVEAHDEAELTRALEAHASLIGVNNRDLTTFRTDPGVAERLAAMLGGDTVTVAESGVGDGAAAARMRAAGYDAILVGEALVRSDDPQHLLAELRGAR